MGLTWGQLKAKVETKLKEAGRDNNIEINYMDFSGSDEEVKASTGGVEVYIGSDGLTVQ